MCPWAGILARMDERQVETLLAVARFLAGQVAPAVIEHEVAMRGYVPVFIDGTGCSSARCGRAGGCIRGCRGLARAA